MSKHPQIEHLIDQAMHRVAEKGSSAELADVIWAGFGFLRDELQPKRGMSFKWVATVGAGVTAFLWGMMKTIPEVLR